MQLAPLCFLAVLGAAPDHRDFFTITVVDEQTGRGVPLVELRTVNDITHFTDSNGIVAFHEPGLMGKEVFFHVASHGYEFPKDGFGYRGKKLHVVAGGSAKLKVKRLNIAERLYRITGGGIYRDSVLVGAKAPLKEPVLNGLVFGSDSVQNAVYRGKIYWFWGDTNRPAYPLGNFEVPGATSELPAAGGLDADVGVNLRYFVDDKGFARPTAPMPGKGPTWLTTVVPLKDKEGRERLLGSFVKVEAPLKIYARGVAVFNDANERFERLCEVDMNATAFPMGHALRHMEDGVEHVYFSSPFPFTRVRATADDFPHSDRYETFSCLKDGTKVHEAKFDRDEQGRMRYAWRKNTPALGPGEEARLIKAGKLTRSEARAQLYDRDSGQVVLAHAGSVYFNEYRKRWVMITVQSGGTSFLGEVWYAEADTPLGPWAYAVKVVTHDRYSFYNPKQHPMFDKDGGRVIFFEGTYTHTFSGNPTATPRYDYNQIMYRLDLSDARLALPAPMYDVSAGDVPNEFSRRGKHDARVTFYAPDRPLAGTVPVVADKDGWRVGDAQAAAVFYALPPDTKAPPKRTTPLYEYRARDGGRRVYAVNPALRLAGYERTAKPLCLVWRPPGD